MKISNLCYYLKHYFIITNCTFKMTSPFTSSISCNLKKNIRTFSFSKYSEYFQIQREEYSNTFKILRLVYLPN